MVLLRRGGRWRQMQCVQTGGYLLVAVRSLYTKKAQGGGGGSPATVPWKGGGAEEGTRQQAGVRTGFLETAQLLEWATGEKAKLNWLQKPRIAKSSTSRSPTHSQRGQSGVWLMGHDGASSLFYIQVLLPLWSRGDPSRPSRPGW